MSSSSSAALASSMASSARVLGTRLNSPPLASQIHDSSHSYEGRNRAMKRGSGDHVETRSGDNIDTQSGDHVDTPCLWYYEIRETSARQLWR